MYADGTLIGDSNGVYRTDEAGEIRITGLKPGKSVVVTETRAPAGFILDTQSQTVQIKEGLKRTVTTLCSPLSASIMVSEDWMMLYPSRDPRPRGVHSGYAIPDSAD